MERETLTQIRERRYGGKWNATGKLTIERDFKETDRETRSRSESRERKPERTIGYLREVIDAL